MYNSYDAVGVCVCVRSLPNKQPVFNACSSHLKNDNREEGCTGGQRGKTNV